MPRRDDLRCIFVVGSGPIVIGQACEFDYSGTQAVRALKSEGYRVILVNNNPASVMTDPTLADRSYLEPLTPATLERIIERERPDALLPTMGGQTALNLTIALAESGVLERHHIELLGASLQTIRKAEDRALFDAAMREAGLVTARGGFAHDLDEAATIAEGIGFPLVLRPSFTLGGSGGAVVRRRDELEKAVAWALELSMNHEVLLEESLLGWKEFELEVMRDRADNAVIVCSIENLDPMGVHTGDSVTVAPQQTLSDPEYQAMRDEALRAVRALGLETGGCNIQFAVDPLTGSRRVIEVNPRVSRSSALASKATGFPIAKIAARLAVGYTLDEITNDITGVTPSSFEPTLDYVVVKIPRFTFEKFPGSDSLLGTQMKSVGEGMAIGRSFQEALGKGLRGMEDGRAGLGDDEVPPESILEQLRAPRPGRIFLLRHALRAGISVEELHRVTAIDPWFLGAIAEMVEAEEAIRRRAAAGGELTVEEMREAKSLGFSDAQLAAFYRVDEREMARRRRALGVRPVYKMVDTCAGEFQARTPYLYSTYEGEEEAQPEEGRKVLVLGSGPNRIGQGIEFDTCCVDAVLALREEGLRTLLVNCNPETVSTDYDISDRLFFEPLTEEDVLEIVHRERPDGVILSLGGQTPLKMARRLKEEGVPIWGTSPESIDRAEDRRRFVELAAELSLRLPESALAESVEEARRAAGEIGYPVLVRPSYVLGGRAMAICDDPGDLERALQGMLEGNEDLVGPDRPLLVDRFLEGATELDVDLLADGEGAVICGILQHVEHAGVHSGDSSCILPPLDVAPELLDRVRSQAKALARALGVVGPMNIQFALLEDEVYVLEANPRASRTLPFVSKATGVPVAAMAAKIMAGRSLRELGLEEEPTPRHVSVKACAFPFHKFPGADVHPGPEMRSTGESMGVASRFGPAFAKALAGVGEALPLAGTAFLSVGRGDRMGLMPIATRLRRLRFTLSATPGTADFLRERGFTVERVGKLGRGERDLLSLIENGEVQLVLCTPEGGTARRDDESIRRACVAHGLPFLTTLQAGYSAVEAIRALSFRGEDVFCLQELRNEPRQVR